MAQTLNEQERRLIMSLVENHGASNVLTVVAAQLELSAQDPSYSKSSQKHYADGSDEVMRVANNMTGW